MLTVIYRLTLLETHYLYKLLDNIFAKEFKNSTISFLMVLQMREEVKCTFLFPMLGGLGEYMSDIAIQVVPSSLVLLRNDSNPLVKGFSAAITDNG